MIGVQDVGLSEEDTLPKLQEPTIESNVGEVNIVNSTGNHIGPRIYAQSVNVIHTDGVHSSKVKRKLLWLGVFLGPLILSIFCLTAITLLVLEESVGGATEPTEAPSPHTSPGGSTSQHTTPFPATSPASPASTDSPPNRLRYINHADWSINRLGDCYPMQNIRTVSIDSLPPCTDDMSCEYLLRGREESDGLVYNFHISQDGGIYEGWGWKCAPSYRTDFSRNIIRVAILGDEMKSGHKLAIMNLMESDKLSDGYNLVPECCRGIPGRYGPGQRIISSLTDVDRKGSFINKNCALKNPLCTRLI